MSGKSLVFYTAGIDTIAKNSSSKIIAIYPLKALGREQENRWVKAIEKAGLKASVGRIDGDISVNKRKSILKNCQVVIMTPDIIHTWLLSNMDDRGIIRFLTSVKLLIVDEVHTYTGVFGSNSSFFCLEE